MEPLASVAPSRWTGPVSVTAMSARPSPRGVVAWITRVVRPVCAGGLAGAAGAAPGFGPDGVWAGAGMAAAMEARSRRVRMPSV